MSTDDLKQFHQKVWIKRIKTVKSVMFWKWFGVYKDFFFLPFTVSFTFQWKLLFFLVYVTIYNI